MPGHVNNLCRTASLAIRDIGRIRKYLDQPSTERLVHAFVTSNLIIVIAFRMVYL